VSFRGNPRIPVDVVGMGGLLNTYVPMAAATEILLGSPPVGLGYRLHCISFDTTNRGALIRTFTIFPFTVDTLAQFPGGPSFFLLDGLLVPSGWTLSYTVTAPGGNVALDYDLVAAASIL
jgi:hypothetical protein